MKRRLLRYVLPALFVLGAVYPAWQILAAIRRPPPVDHRLLSADPSSLASANPGLLRWLGHATLVASAVALAAVVLASAGAYALSRRRRLHGPSGGPKGLPVTQMFAALTLLLPLYLLLIPLHRINPHVGVVFVHTITVLPFCLWQMKNAYDAIPVSLEEAARLDGCGPWQTFGRVILPLASPGLVTTTLFAFAAAWNEAMVAALIRPDSRWPTMSAGSGSVFPANLSAPWLCYAAAVVLTVSAPVVGLLLVSGRGRTGGLVEE